MYMHVYAHAPHITFFSCVSMIYSYLYVYVYNYIEMLARTVLQQIGISLWISHIHLHVISAFICPSVSVTAI